VLESTDGETQGFASLEALFAYLQAETFKGASTHRRDAGDTGPQRLSSRPAGAAGVEEL
jgi:hypothetical protein